MPSAAQRVAERYARNQIQKAKAILGDPSQDIAHSCVAAQSEKSVQVANDASRTRGSGDRSFAADDPRSLATWQRALWRIAKGVLVQLALNQKDKPQEADLEVDGEEMDTDWDEPATDWMTAKKAAVRRAIACLLNDAASLPEIGRRVERIVYRTGTVDIYFDDGSFVSAQVEDPQQPVTESPCGCGPLRKHAVPTVDMVAAVRPNKELLGAQDARKIGVKTTRWWGYQIDPPFDLWLLREVPMNLARDLTDFPNRVTHLRNPRHAWDVAQEFADKGPFQRRR